MKNFPEFDILLDMALAEDLGNAGDVTSEAIFDDEKTDAELISKDEGVLAGIDCFRAVYQRIDPGISVLPLLPDGSRLSLGTRVAGITGKTRSILAGERTAINFLAFLSGIATGTEKYVTAAKNHGKALVLDTRKTLPGYRRLSKYAVTLGGGVNHRMGLYDMVLIKDNHIDAAGSLTKAVEKVRDKWGSKFRIEVECRGIDEVREALDAGVDIIMLDNMDSPKAREAAALGKGRAKFESSGDMTPERVAEYSPIGIDYISVGKLTHSVKAFDFSLRVKKD